MSDSQIHEYRHVNGEDSISVPAGSETDLAYSSEPDWQLVGERQPVAPVEEPEVASEPEEPAEDDESPVEPEDDEPTE